MWSLRLAIACACFGNTVAAGVWKMVDGMTRVMPTQRVVSAEATSTMHLLLAKNERESFQLVYAPGTGASSAITCDVEVMQQGSPVQLRWGQVGFVFADSIYPNPQGKGGAWWPDPIFPSEQLPDGKAWLPSNVTSSLWFDVYAPGSSTSGNHSIQVSATTSDGIKSLFTVTVTISAVTLPVIPTLKSAFDLSQSKLGLSYKTLSQDMLHQMWINYAHELLTTYRLNPGNFYESDGMLKPDEAASLARLGMNSFFIASVKPNLTQATKQAEALENYVQELRERNLTRATSGGRVVASVYGFDESDQTKFASVIQEVFGMFKRKYPDVNTVTTAHMNDNKTGHPEQSASKIRNLHIDNFCPIMDWVVPEQLRECEADNLPMWMYTSLEPGLPWPNLRLDNRLIDPRVLLWLVAGWRLDGFLYWGLNQWLDSGASFLPLNLTDQILSRGPFLNPAQWTMKTSGFPGLQGDGKLLYAGINGLIPSMRLASLRDGLEDNQLLELLAQSRGGSAMLDLIQPVISTSTPKNNHTQDPEVLLTQRKQLMTLLQSAQDEVHVAMVV